MPTEDLATAQQTNFENNDETYHPEKKLNKSKPKKSKSRKSKLDKHDKNDSIQKQQIDMNINQKEEINNKQNNNYTQRKNQLKNENLSTKTSLQNNGIQKQKKQNNDSLSWGSNSKFAISQFQRKKSLLQVQLKQKDDIIDKLKNQRQLHFQKYAKLKVDYQEIKINNKKILQKQLRQRADIIRKEKAQINPSLGYYKHTSWTMFIEGDYLLKAKQKVQQLQKSIEQLQQKKRNSREQDRQRIIYQIQFLKKSKQEAVELLRNREVEVNTYKNRLRLADKEQNCTFAKSNWPLINDRYLPMELIGSGGFGQVYKCYDLQKNTYVALKTNCFQPNKSPQHKQQFVKHVQRQIQTLKCLNHPNIAKLIEQIQVDSNKISFVMQYCSGPELSKYLVKNGNLQQKQAKGIIKQISFALKYMFDQKNRIIHYDLKPANIIFHNGTVKIIDFGLCKKMQTEDTKIDLTSQGVGTYWYLPPQTFKQFAQISSKVDIWSLGVIFFQLLYGKKPFGHGINQNKIFTDGIILKALKVQFPVQKKIKVSQQAKNFIRECLKYNPQQRLDPKQLYQHPYLN